MMPTPWDCPEPARFRLVREHDVSGVSGTGTVAYGVWWPTGLVAVAWNSQTPTVTTFLGLDDVATVHGHEGNTVLEWIDDEPAAIRQAISSAVIRL